MPQSPSTIAAWIGAGRLALKDAANSLRLWAAFRDGRSTPPQRRRAVLRLIGMTSAKLADLAKSLADRLPIGLATLAGWKRDSLSAIAAGHFAGMMAATGTDDPAPADVDVAAEAVDRQGMYLDRFAVDLATGRTPIWASGATGKGEAKPLGVAAKAKNAARSIAGAFLARIGLYPHAIWGTAEAVAREKMRRAGYTLERRMLGAGPGERHCAACKELAGLGWQPIGSLPAIGEGTPCRSRCLCRWAFTHEAARRAVASPMAMA